MKSLIRCSEKAACIARACRNEKDLFQLLVEEKIGEDKNKNSSHDFKTLADVLIQESIRYDMGKEFPELKDSIQGEESNKFTNTLGESIQVEVCSTLEETSKLLSRVLTGNQNAADILAKLVHYDAKPEFEDVDKIPDDSEFNVEDLGIWIDPIDGTNNYVRGKDEIDALKIETDEVVAKGLPVVTVLIGVFSKSTGTPLAGVVNQPFAFYDKQTKGWSGRIHWGCEYASQLFNNSKLPKTLSEKPESATEKVILSLSGEPSEVVERLKPHYECIPAGGAGHKILCVFLGLVDVYVTSKASTYKWDTCAGQALLQSIGGGCIEYVNHENGLKYNHPNPGSGISQWCNNQGVIAFRHKSQLEKLQSILNNTG